MSERSPRSRSLVQVVTSRSFSACLPALLSRPSSRLIPHGIIRVLGRRPTTLLLLAFFFVSTPSAWAVDRYVWQNSPSPDPVTVPAAVRYTNPLNAARTITDVEVAAFPGDTIMVIGPGLTYPEPPITIKPDQTVLGGTITITGGGGGPVGGGTFQFTEGPCTSAIITGDGSGPIFTCAGSATIRGLTFRDNVISGDGAGILAAGSGSVEIRNCCFRDLTAARGGAISASLVTLHVHHCTFTTSHASSGCGGAILAKDASTTIADCILIANRAADSGGAICIDDCPEATVGECTIDGNQCTSGMGGGIYVVHSANVSIHFCPLSANVAPMGGGLGFKACALTTVRDCEIRDHVESNEGAGAMVTKESIVAFERCRFLFNKSKKDGGGLLARGKSQLTMRTNVFEVNESGGEGGGLRVEQKSTLDSTDDVFHLNHAKGVGGGISLRDATSADVKHARFTDNTVISAEAKGENNGFGNGAGLASDRCKDLTVRNQTLFDSNRTSNDGGGLWILRSFGDVRECTFQNLNRARDDGGACYVKDSQVSVTECILTNNRAYSDGGGLYLSTGARVTFSGFGSIDHNQSGLNGDLGKGHGGGAYTRNSSLLIDGDVHIDQNGTAVGRGGGVFAFDDRGFVEMGFQSLMGLVFGSITTRLGVSVTNNVSEAGGGGIGVLGLRGGLCQFDLEDTPFASNHGLSQDCQFDAVSATGSSTRCDFSGSASAICVSNSGTSKASILFDHVHVTSAAWGYDLLASDVSLEHCTVEGAVLTGLSAEDCSVAIESSKFAIEGQDQISLASRCKVRIRASILDGSFGSAVGISVGEKSNLDIQFSHVMYHSQFGILKVPPQPPIAIAANNYWGAPGGPAHATNLDPRLKGNAVSSFVNFSSHRATPYPPTFVGPQ